MTSLNQSITFSCAWAYDMSEHTHTHTIIGLYFFVRHLSRSVCQIFVRKDITGQIKLGPNLPCWAGFADCRYTVNSQWVPRYSLVSYYPGSKIGNRVPMKLGSRLELDLETLGPYPVWFSLLVRRQQSICRCNYNYFNKEHKLSYS